MTYLIELNAIRDREDENDPNVRAKLVLLDQNFLFYLDSIQLDVSIAKY